jgi:gamma-glutamyltranspeptidase
MPQQPVWPWLGHYETFPELSGCRPVIGDRGMVSSPHAQASVIGLEVLKQGGNAVDAAIATSAALMVTCPMQCGPGGDAFWLIGRKDDNVVALDASGRSPAQADAEALRAQGLRTIPPRSGYAVTVPGAVDGWVTAHKEFGTLPLAQLLEPAAELAERGIHASRHFYASFQACADELRAKDTLCLWSDSRRFPAVYDRIRQPALAKTLRLVGATSGRAFYNGPLSRAMAQATRNAGGWLSEDDLAGHSSEWVEPLSTAFHDLLVYTTPPSTQGFGLLAALRRVAAASQDPLDVYSADGIHLLIEAAAAVLADRDLYNDDRSRVITDVRDLWSDDVSRRFMTAHDRNQRSEVASLGTSRTTKGDTSHLAVIDRDGMAVSLIQSLFFDFGSCIPVEEGGFPLQNRGAAFHLEEGRPGLLAPGIRPVSTLMPCIATRDGAPALVMGCMGGEGQMQTLLQIIVDLCHSRLDPQQSVSRARWFLDRSTPEGAVVMMETGIDRAVVDDLKTRGHRVQVMGVAEDLMGHAQVIRVERSGALVGAADPRSDGLVAAD